MAHPFPKRSQYKYTKKAYRVRNWCEYEMALRKRGELTLWFSKDAIEVWHAPASSKPGGQRIYSDLAIETALTVRAVYRLGLRQTEGFLKSVGALLIPTPDHTTLSRRSKQLHRIRDCRLAADGLVHILVDSTELKVHSGNDPRAEITSSRRAWCKLHLVVGATSGGVLASEITSHQSGDASQVPNLLSQIDGELASMSADGAYDATPVYKAIESHPSADPIRIIIPPRRNARVSRISGAAVSQRDRHIQSICKIGRRRWQKEPDYTRRSLIEAAISRYKCIIGSRLRSRTVLSQADRGKNCVCFPEQNDSAWNARRLLCRLSRQTEERASVFRRPRCNKVDRTRHT